MTDRHRNKNQNMTMKLVCNGRIVRGSIVIIISLMFNVPGLILLTAGIRYINKYPTTLNILLLFGGIMCSLGMVLLILGGVLCVIGWRHDPRDGEDELPIVSLISSTEQGESTDLIVVEDIALQKLQT